MAKTSGFATVAAAVEQVRAEIEGLKNQVSQIGVSTADIIDCLLNGPPKPDLLTEAIKPIVAKQEFDKDDQTKGKLILTLITPKGAKQRVVEVVFEGVEAPPLRERISGTASGQGELEFGLPDLWKEQKATRFVTVNIIDTTKAPKKTPKGPTTATPTMRRILPAIDPKHDDDND